MKLGKNNYNILCMGIKMAQTWSGAYWYGLEQFYSNEADIIRGFCEWMDNTGKSMGHGNYEERFKEYLQTKNVYICSI